MEKNSEIVLRPITKNDTDLILKWRNNDQVKKFFIFQNDLTIKQHKKWLKEHIKEKKAYQFIIEVKEKKTPIGSVYIRDVDLKNLKAEFGIFIGNNDYRGCGLGTVATKSILDFAFNELNLNKVYLRVFSDNKKAINVYRKVGFLQEGLFKKEVKINNVFHDIVFMGILKENYCE